MQTLDARRLMCPMPVIRTQDCVATLAPGTELRVLCTDPGAAQDIPAWCWLNGHVVKQVTEAGHELHIVIEVGTPV